jgi:tRNA A-37 threonylcarbamoyl transferase component Bud32
MIGRYSILRELGSGKEGRVYSVTDSKGKKFALKQFKSRKSATAIIKEATLQTKAYNAGVAPKVISIDTNLKFILMEEMDTPLVSVITNRKGVLLKKTQIDILSLFDRLDRAGVFHADPNLSNYMMHGTRVVLIDYGMSKDITPALIRKLKTDSPNKLLMTMGFIIKLREGGCPAKSYKFLEESLR